jgi:hypothetical protein
VGGGCPSWLFEPQATNSFLNSNAPATQAVTVANATVYTISVRGIGVATLSGAATGVITGTDSEGSSLTVTTSSNSLIVTVTGLSGTVYVQVEIGSIATSPIITAGSAVTRLKDVSSIPCTATTAYSIIAEFTTQGPVTTRYVFDFSNGSGRQGLLIKNSTNKISFIPWLNGSPLSAIESVADGNVGLNKAAIIFTGTQYRLIVNGAAAVVSNQVGGFPTFLQYGPTFADENSSNLFNEQLIFNTAISDAEAIALTT